MKVTIQAFSSSGGSYSVEFSDETGSMRVFCHCNAGVTQQMCKHKAALIRGDARMLYNQADAPLLKKFLESPAYPALKARFEQYENALAILEREIAAVKEKEKNIKKEFVHELSFGKSSSQPLPNSVQPRQRL